MRQDTSGREHTRSVQAHRPWSDAQWKTSRGCASYRRTSAIARAWCSVTPLRTLLPARPRTLWICSNVTVSPRPATHARWLVFSCSDNPQYTVSMVTSARRVGGTLFLTSARRVGGTLFQDHSMMRRQMRCGSRALT
eukprot:3170426-Rhodomonas_salina.2